MKRLLSVLNVMQNTTGCEHLAAGKEMWFYLYTANSDVNTCVDNIMQTPNEGGVYYSDYRNTDPNRVMMRSLRYLSITY